MTDRDIARLGPAFSSYLGRYRDCFLQDRIVGHFDDYCRGLLSEHGADAAPDRDGAPVSIHTDRLRGGNPQVTREQVCRASNVRCAILFRRRRRTPETSHVGEVIRDHQRRNEQATRSQEKRPHKRIIYTPSGCE